MYFLITFPPIYTYTGVESRISTFEVEQPINSRDPSSFKKKKGTEHISIADPMYLPSTSYKSVKDTIHSEDIMFGGKTFT